MASSPGQLSKAIYPGEQVDAQFTVSPAGASAGWVFALVPCMAPPGAGVPPIANPSADTYTFSFSTVGWPIGSYHWTVWRQSPQPQCLLDVRIFVKGC